MIGRTRVLDCNLPWTPMAWRVLGGLRWTYDAPMVTHALVPTEWLLRNGQRVVCRPKR